MTGFDAAVVGLGPAGRALAHRLLAAGAEVLAIDPAPERPWSQTLAGWQRDLPAWLPEGAIGVRGVRVAMRVSRFRVLAERYAVLDAPALQEALRLDGARLEARAVGAAELDRLRERARLVVDARGALPAGLVGPVPRQTAFGVFLPPETARALLPEGADAVLMDWTPAGPAAAADEGPPSFCYTIPAPDGSLLVEETCLAGRPALDGARLRRRLSERLRRHGVGPDAIEGARREEVSIPLLRPGRGTPGVLRFGAAGGQGNPVTGYSVFQSLAEADATARSILSGAAPPGRDRPSALRRLALRALLRSRAGVVRELFDAFARLPPRAQRTILDPRAEAAPLLLAMTRQAALMPPRARIALSRATLL